MYLYCALAEMAVSAVDHELVAEAPGRYRPFLRPLDACGKRRECVEKLEE